MKFDKYVKMVGTMGVIASYQGKKYLCAGISGTIGHVYGGVGDEIQQRKVFEACGQPYQEQIA